MVFFLVGSMGIFNFSEGFFNIRNVELGFKELDGLIFGFYYVFGDVKFGNYNLFVFKFFCFK